jgi:signal transduction histidine kinase
MLQAMRGKRLDDAEVDRGLDVILRNANLQAQLIEDIFDVARISTGILHLTLREVEVVPLIRVGLETIAPAAQAKGICIEAELDPAVATISADPERIQQIVLNLLSNAVKFTPRGGRIAIRVERREGSVRIQVSDTGQGIRADFLPFVFDRYRQADSSVTRAHGGLGLGLAIVRHLVELHGGTIAAESDGEERGATFTVTFPTRETPR